MLGWTIAKSVVGKSAVSKSWKPYKLVVVVLLRRVGSCYKKHGKRFVQRLNIKSNHTVCHRYRRIFCWHPTGIYSLSNETNLCRTSCILLGWIRRHRSIHKGASPTAKYLHWQSIKWSNRHHGPHYHSSIFPWRHSTFWQSLLAKYIRCTTTALLFRCRMGCHLAHDFRDCEEDQPSTKQRGSGFDLVVCAL